jgi:hypothetical protein
VEDVGVGLSSEDIMVFVGNVHPEQLPIIYNSVYVLMDLFITQLIMFV